MIPVLLSPTFGLDDLSLVNQPFLNNGCGKLPVPETELSSFFNKQRQFNRCDLQYTVDAFSADVQS